MLHFDFLSGLKWVLKITVRGIDEKRQCWTENKTDFKMKGISSCHVSKVMLSSNEYIMKYSFWWMYYGVLNYLSKIALKYIP